MIQLHLITEIDVKLAIKKMKPKTSLSPDDGLYLELKIKTVSKIAPVPKTEDTMDIANHRPIALISVLAKIFESILQRQIYAQVDNQIVNSQHGFR